MHARTVTPPQSRWISRSAPPTDWHGHRKWEYEITGRHHCRTIMTEKKRSIHCVYPYEVEAYTRTSEDNRILSPLVAEVYEAMKRKKRKHARWPRKMRTRMDYLECTPCRAVFERIFLCPCHSTRTSCTYNGTGDQRKTVTISSYQATVALTTRSLKHERHQLRLGSNFQLLEAAVATHSRLR